MKTIKPYPPKRYLPAFLSLLMILASCDSQNESVEPSIASYDGKEIFKGLMFSRGEVASMFPELSKEIVARASLDGDMLNHLVKLEDDIVRIIEAKSPNYFNEFKASIVSGKHLVIQEALRDGERSLEAAAYDISGYQVSTKTLKNAADRISQEFDINEFMEEDGSVNLEKLEEIKKLANAKIDEECLALALAVAWVAVYYKFWLWGSSADSPEFKADLSLKEEQLIAAIANASIDKADSKLLTYVP